jgi:hypothetical protein
MVVASRTSASGSVVGPAGGGGRGGGCCGNGIKVLEGGIVPSGLSVAVLLLAFMGVLSVGSSDGIFRSNGAVGELWKSPSLGVVVGSCGVGTAVGELQKWSSVVSITRAQRRVVLVAVGR